jgi:hypothetical protein
VWWSALTVALAAVLRLVDILSLWGSGAVAIAHSQSTDDDSAAKEAYDGCRQA